MIRITDMASLQEAVAEVQAMDLPADSGQLLAARRHVVRRARMLNCMSGVPSEWRGAASLTTPAPEVSAPPTIPAAEMRLRAKSVQSGVDLDTLRTAYMNGVREFAMMEPAKRPPFSRDVFAQSKVNTIIFDHVGHDTGETA